MKATLLDTGVIVALLDNDERYHSRCVDVVSDVAGPLATCEASIAEACCLLRNIRESVIKNVAKGVFQIPVRLVDQTNAVEKLLRKYEDVPMDLADQLGTGQVLTLDGDFEVYRWRSRRRFELLIEL